jgi:enoyl-CoA hydratase/carnithine racemase
MWHGPGDVMHVKQQVEGVEAASAGTVRLEDNGVFVTIVLNRPDKMNAISCSVLAGIRRAIQAAEQMPSVKSIVIRGEGRAFSAGGDLEEVSALVADSRRFNEFLDYWHESLNLVEDCELPTIAAVHGIAFAGGFELTQVCDFVVLGEQTRIGDQHANLGLFPAGGSTQRLTRLIGPRLAKWMLMTGTTITPREALTVGLVNEVVEEDQVLCRAEEMASSFAARSRRASAEIKRALAFAEGMSIRDALRLERPIAVRHMASEDARIGMTAFKARTTPTFD